jgi:elongation factor P
MASTADIRNGFVIRFNHDIYQVVEFLHVKPGKGAAFVRTKLRSLTTGRVLDNTFPSGAKLEEVRVERRKYQFLYPDGNQFVFMNTETFDQINIDGKQIESSDLMLEGAECDIMIDADQDKVLGVEIPNFVVMEVTYTEPGLRGDTATNTLKPATVDSGAEIRVPLFVNQGDKIKIDTRTRSYVERVK